MTIGSTSKLSLLELVYPPISNQEAVWLKDDPEVKARIQQSDFYMIAARAEIKFVNYQFDNKIGRIDFSISTIGGVFDSVSLVVEKLSAMAHRENSGYEIEMGEKIVRIWSGKMDDPDSKCLEWFTTEKLIWNKSRGIPGIEGFNRYRELSTYELLYIGIAKVRDTYDRLFKRAHMARMEILANEAQRHPGARVADEIYLFLFRVAPIVTQLFDPFKISNEEDIVRSFNKKRIVADAEKAFVSLLKPKYNKTVFTNYPKGDDGLYYAGYQRYQYLIAENITFETPHCCMSGGRDNSQNFVSNDADSIFVEGENVKFHRAGHKSAEHH